MGSYDDIKTIQYERYDEVSTTVDLKIIFRQGQVDGLKDATFSSIDRKEAPMLTKFLSSKPKLNFIVPKEKQRGRGGMAEMEELDEEDDEEDDESYHGGSDSDVE